MVTVTMLEKKLLTECTQVSFYKRSLTKYSFEEVKEKVWPKFSISLFTFLFSALCLISPSSLTPAAVPGNDPLLQPCKVTEQLFQFLFLKNKIGKKTQNLLSTSSKITHLTEHGQGVSHDKKCPCFPTPVKW